MENTVANTNRMPYNKFNTLIRESNRNKENEGGTENGIESIISSGRCSVPEPDLGGRTRDHREIRDAEENLSDGKQEESVSEPVADRKTEQPSSGSGADSQREDGSSAERIGEEIPVTGQEERSDGMDRPPEYADDNGRGEHLEGIGIQLSEDTTEQDLSEAEEEIASALSLPDLSTVKEQIRNIEERTAALYAGEIAIPAEVVDEVLRTGSNQNKSQLRIIYNYMSEQTLEEYVEFLKKEYGTGGESVRDYGMQYSVFFDELGMQIAVGHTVTDQVLSESLPFMGGCKRTYSSVAKARGVCSAGGTGCGKGQCGTGTRTGVLVISRRYGGRCGGIGFRGRFWTYLSPKNGENCRADL